MNRTLFSRTLALFHRSQVPRPALATAPDGRSALLAFPRFPDLGESASLDALDAWLGDHPTCSVVLLNELPSGRTLRRVQAICRRRGCAFMVRASKTQAVAA